MSQWEMVKLGEVGESFIGLTYKPTDISDNGTPVLRSGNIQSSKIELSDLVRVNKKIKDKLYLADNDILVCSRNGSAKLVGKSARIDKLTEKMTFGAFMMIYRSKYNHYISYFFQSPYFKRQLSRCSTTTINQLTKNMLDEVTIPLPPLETQQHMAKTLDLATEIIEGYRQKLTELDKLVQSVFYEMFGDPVENEKGWEKSTIRDVLESAKYGTSQPSRDDGKYTYLRMNNITYDGYLDLSQTKTIDIDEKDYEKCVVRKNDILFNRTNSKELVGKTCVFNLDEEMIIAGYIIRVRVNEKVLPVYLSRVLNSRYGKMLLADMCKSSIGQANINAQELQNIKILVPPIPLQQQFAQIVEKIEEEKALVQEGLREAEQLFGGLLQEYFEG